MEIKIPEAARVKLFAAYQQRESVVQQFDAALQLAFDSMGVEGKVVGVDLATGMVTVEDVAKETEPPEPEAEG